MLAFRSARIAVAIVAIVAVAALPSFAQEPSPPPADEKVAAADVPMTEAEMQAAFKAMYSFQDGPVVGDLGEATIKVPAGSMFTGKAGTNKWNLQSAGREDDASRGLITSADGRWMLLFTYDDTGHIPDDEKDDLDADDMIESYQEGQKSANEARQAQGIEPIFIDGWEQAPAYNDKEKVLEWALKAHSPSSARIVNFNTRLLGRTGVMSAILMYGDDVQLKDIITDYRTLLAGFAFKNGQNYSEFRKGDKLAEYGLAALVAGGGVAVAAKTGLLAKLGLIFAKGGKAIVIAIAALGAGIASRLKRFFGDKG